MKGTYKHKRGSLSHYPLPRRYSVRRTLATPENTLRRLRLVLTAGQVLVPDRAAARFLQILLRRIFAHSLATVSADVLRCRTGFQRYSVVLAFSMKTRRQLPISSQWNRIYATIPLPTSCGGLWAGALLGCLLSQLSCVFYGKGENNRMEAYGCYWHLKELTGFFKSRRGTAYAVRLTP